MLSNTSTQGTGKTISIGASSKMGHNLYKILVLGAILVYIPSFVEGSDNTTTTVESLNETTTETPMTNATETRLVLTEEQYGKLLKFSEKMLPELTRDYMLNSTWLTRWLIARDWDADQAEQMLRSHLQWRKEQDMDNIFLEDWSDMLEDFPYTNDTRDKAGRPIGTLSIEHWNIRAASYAGRMNRLHRYVQRLLEEASQGVHTLQRRGIPVMKWKVLMNLDGFGIRTHACTSCLSFYQNFIQVYEDHYPGYADAIVMINAPGTFRVVMNVIKPFMSSRTKDVVKVYGRNEKTWGEYLDQEIDKNQRRAEFGGLKEDPLVEHNATQLYLKNSLF